MDPDIHPHATLEQIRSEATYFKVEDWQRQIRQCVNFLREIRPDMSPTAFCKRQARKQSGYYKHLVEKAGYGGHLSDKGYIFEGAFIEAAIVLGYPTKRLYPGDQKFSCVFGFDRKDAKRLTKLVESLP